MKKHYIAALLVFLAVLAGCTTVAPQSEAEREFQKQQEDQRRIKADHFAR
jgi:starvation-inducible outer membrane lipoprotein